MHELRQSYCQIYTCRHKRSMCCEQNLCEDLLEMFAVAKCPGNNNRSILRFDGVIPVRVEIIEVVNRPWSLVKRWSFLWQSALCQQQQRYNQCAPKNDLHPIAGVGFMLGVRAPRRGPFSDHHRLVWQFVAATCVGWKVFRKFP